MDPLSIILFVFTAVKFIKETAPGIHEVVHNTRYGPSQRRFDNLLSQLETCLSRYELWSRIWWEGDIVYDTQYEDIWTRDGWIAIKRLRGGISTLVKDILVAFGECKRKGLDQCTIHKRDEFMQRTRYLQLSQLETSDRRNFTSEDARIWLGLDDILQTQSGKFWKRFWYAIYEHGRIENLLSELSGNIDRIWTNSKTNFELAYNLEDQERLVRRIKTLISLSRLAHFLCNDESVAAGDSEWIVHLEHPNGIPITSADGLWDLLDERKLRLTVKQHGLTGPPETKTLVFELRQPRRFGQRILAPDISAFSLSNLLRLASLPNARNMSFEKQVYEVRREGILEDTSTLTNRPILGHINSIKLSPGDKHIACAAVTLGFMTMWRVPYYDRLCRHHMFTVTEPAHEGVGEGAAGVYPKFVFRPWTVHTRNQGCPKCRPIEYNARALDNFGHLLAEITTGTVLRRRRLSYVAGGETYGRSMNTTELVEFVGASDALMAKAVKWCLEPDTRRERRVGGSRYADVIDMKSEVLEKIIMSQQLNVAKRNRRSRRRTA